MDADRFDALTRRLHRRAARRITRREGLSLAFLSILATRQTAEAACKRQGASCKKPAECCTEVCDTFGKKKKCWCKRLGETCTKTSNCCSFPSMFCDRVGRKRVCCLGVGEPCSATKQCCGDAQCDAGTCVLCREEGESCAGAIGCCRDLECDAGTCVDIIGEG